MKSRYYWIYYLIFASCEQPFHVHAHLNRHIPQETLLSLFLESHLSFSSFTGEIYKHKECPLTGLSFEEDIIQCPVYAHYFLSYSAVLSVGVKALTKEELWGWLLWREVGDWTMPVTDGSNWLQQTHHRTQLSPSVKLVVRRGKHI